MPATTFARAVLLLCLWLAPATIHAQATPAAASGATGRVAGKVIDAQTGRPLQAARVLVVGQTNPMETDLEGRYRTGPIPVGRRSVQVAVIGYKPSRRDSVLVEANGTVTVDFTLIPAPIELQGISVEAEIPPKPNQDAGLLAMQQAAASVTDGISEQAIKRSPDSDAGEAVKRVTGVTLFDGKFLIVRGLGERYSNALLNGAEMPNPVVEKKIAPLDLFPASLLSAVVASKTATPDKPGDFAGGSVELTTKDFPESRVLEFKFSQSYNDQLTFQKVPLPRHQGTDFIAVDDGRRNPPVIPYGDTQADRVPRVLQGFKDNVWNPTPRQVAPGTGFSATYGDQAQWGSGSALGYIASVTYNNKSSYTPDRLYNLYYVGREGTNSVDWGGVLNFTLKPGPSSKISWRNLYTRSADETARYASGLCEGCASFERSYQMRYVERYLWQTQLAGEHAIHGAGFAWKGTFGRANIYDPDNHLAKYQTDVDEGGVPSVSGKRLVRRLTDRTWSGQLDATLPFRWRREGDALFKSGFYYRSKHRDYYARDVLINRSDATASATGLDPVIGNLPPEQAFAPENLGTYFTYVPSANHDDPYFADDRVAAVYGMFDVPLLTRLRAVVGVRGEGWMLDLCPGADDPLGDCIANDSTIRKRDLDALPSANLTLSLSNRMQVRLAGYRTLARPDSREISPGSYTPVGGTGSCEELGNANLTRSLIWNGDLRWELYPRPGELLAISGFYKNFDHPIIETRTVGAQTGNSTCTVQNGTTARVKGLEFEVRRGLDFLPGFLRSSGVGVNLTVVKSSIDVPNAIGIQPRRFIGQSPLIVNAYFSLDPADGPLGLSVLYNFFGDRISKYSNNQSSTAVPTPNPNWVEKGRGQLDAKLRIRFTQGFRMSIAGKNLTRSVVVVKEDAGARRLVDRYNPGVGISAELSYAF